MGSAAATLDLWQELFSLVSWGKLGNILVSYVSMVMSTVYFSQDFHSASNLPSSKLGSQHFFSGFLERIFLLVFYLNPGFRREFLASSSGRHLQSFHLRVFVILPRLFQSSTFLFLTIFHSQWDFSGSSSWPLLLQSSVTLVLLDSVGLSATSQWPDCNAWKSCSGVSSPLLFFFFFLQSWFLFFCISWFFMYCTFSHWMMEGLLISHFRFGKNTVSDLKSLCGTADLL